MKKILPFIFIALIFANFFAPFSVNMNGATSPAIKKSSVEAAPIAEAAGGNVTIVQTQATGHTISLEIRFERDKTDVHAGFFIVTKTKGLVGEVIKNLADAKNNPSVAAVENFPNLASLPTVDDPQIPGWVIGTASRTVSNLEPNTPYYISAGIWNGTSVSGQAATYDNEIRTIGENETNNNVTLIARVDTEDGFMPSCGPGNTIFTHGTIMGCVAQILYYAVFQPTSFLFGLAGKFFDFTFFYSTSDSSYRSAFVLEGWGVVRDFVNIFFIFVLLYVAFSTILGLSPSKTKGLVINVVIIGLLINFSLFTTQIIIDTSNILARVFYNSDAIKLSKGDNTVTVKPGEPIGLSEAIVAKTEPQKLITQGISKIGITDKVTGKSSVANTSSNIGTGTFILLTLLCIAVNIIGFLVFLSVGLVFVGRVIGLWIAMIFVPLTFFSYTVPAMKDIKIFGWKKWWPETLKLAFLAPIFIFFMYLILKFLNMPDIIDVGDKTGLAFVVAIMVPFAFIIILLNTAKKLAVNFAGEVAGAVTKAGQTIGGVALGAGVGVAAMAGRQTIGRVANKIDKSDWLNDAASGKKGRAAQFFTRDIGLKRATSLTAKASFDARQTAAGNAFSKETGMNLNKGTNFVGLDTKKGLGGYVGVQERKVEKENKFGESLGYNHHQYEQIGDRIESQEDALTEFKLNPKIRGEAVGRNSDEYKREVFRRENEIAKDKKTQERVKTGRSTEHALTHKRKSGKIYDIDKYADDPEMSKKYRDEFDNIKKFGHAEKAAMHGFMEAMKEAGLGAIKGAAAGLVAGSVIPGVGTVLGGLYGGLAGAVRNAVIHSGTENRKVGEAKHGDKHEKIEDKYKEPSPAAASHTTTEGHDKPADGAAHGH